MSTEYKDWKRDKIETEKHIVSEYPFLRLRDIDGAIDAESEFPMMSLEIPNGWYKLFLQMCSDIKPLLEKEGVMDDFYFIQVKEKFNTLRCYSNGVASQEVEAIIAKYEHMAYYICCECGKPAVYETKNYLASYCEDCWKNIARHEDIECIDFKSYYRVIGFAKGEHYDKAISFEDQWSEYMKGLEER